MMRSNSKAGGRPAPPPPDQTDKVAIKIRRDVTIYCTKGTTAESKLALHIELVRQIAEKRRIKEDMIRSSWNP